MGRKKTLYQKAKDSPKSITFAEIQKLAVSAGFILDRQRGSHRQFKRSDAPYHLTTFQPRKGETKMAMAYQVRDLLNYIDQNDLLPGEGSNG